MPALRPARRDSLGGEPVTGFPTRQFLSPHRGWKRWRSRVSRWLELRWSTLWCVLGQQQRGPGGHSRARTPLGAPPPPGTSASAREWRWQPSASVAARLAAHDTGRAQRCGRDLPCARAWARGNPRPAAEPGEQNRRNPLKTRTQRCSRLCSAPRWRQSVAGVQIRISGSD